MADATYFVGDNQRRKRRRVFWQVLSLLFVPFEIGLYFYGVSYFFAEILGYGYTEASMLPAFVLALTSCCGIGALIARYYHEEA